MRALPIRKQRRACYHVVMNATTPPAEGVIRFRLEHTNGPLPGWAEPGEILAWFRRCQALGGIGRYPPERYQGAAFGNISQRGPEGFLITGTQTGGQQALTPGDIAWVKYCDIQENRVVSQGPARPSSESMTHGQLYTLDAGVGFVIHIHDPLLWRQADRLELPVTDPAAEYGTPAMAREVERLMAMPATREGGIFAMGGHEDGLVIFGTDAEQAGLRLLALYRRACARATS
ncbi:conserved hypothetical protein [endosymbiont of unidentified scaly snail isolate Monju]|nr:conserved hypothetical protein [endosymbiont of unidentified scaly snail isolate Monju]